VDGKPGFFYSPKVPLMLFHIHGKTFGTAPKGDSPVALIYQIFGRFPKTTNIVHRTTPGNHFAPFSSADCHAGNPPALKVFDGIIFHGGTKKN
jgi:hypothetical protein